MPMPNNYQQPISYQQPQPPQPQQQYFGQGLNQMPQQGFQNIQPYGNINPTPVMSIAPVSGEENARQFPLAVGTTLYLVDMSARKLYVKSNSADPRDMQEFDLIDVVKPVNQNEPVSRAEFDDLKTMMAQMMGMMQTANSQDSRDQRSDNQRDSVMRQQKQNNGRKGNRHDQSADV